MLNMSRPLVFAWLVPLVMLAGCFASKTQLIEADDAVLPADGSMVVCLEEEDPCLMLVRHDNGYLVEAPGEGEEDLAVRFAPLVQAGGRQVYIAEAEIREEDGPVYSYGLARRFLEPDARGATLQVAGLDCEELDEATLNQFEAGGGIIEGGKVMNCQPTSLDQLKTVLLAVHRDGLGTDEWWAEHGEDF